MKKLSRDFREVSEEVLKRLAYIVGPSSAADLALQDAKARRERGEAVAFYTNGKTLLVGPPAQTANSVPAKGNG